MKKWGLIRSKHHPVETQQQPQEEEQRRQEIKGGKCKSAFSLSPLSWLSKLTAKSSATATAAKPKHAALPANAAAAVGGGFPSCFHKRTSASPESQSSPAAPDIVPRRLSVGNDDAAAARQLCHRRYCSVGGDRDLPLLSNLIPFSRTASPQLAPAHARTSTKPMPPLPPSDTDEEKRLPRSRRRQWRGGARRSFSGRAVAVRVRSPRRAPAAAAVVELERFAVVRRTRDPQRVFRESMVEMIASKRIGRPEELETLLACYLSLNADEHHDCIVKVFRQVWFELNPSRIAAAPPPRT